MAIFCKTINYLVYYFFQKQRFHEMLMRSFRFQHERGLIFFEFRPVIPMLIIKLKILQFYAGMIPSKPGPQWKYKLTTSTAHQSSDKGP